MKLLLIHGAPATGKLTVAKTIHQRVPSRLFDNHTAIDAASTVFDFGAPGFWKLVLDLRLSVLNAAVTENVPLVIMTYCYCEPEDRAEYELFEQAVIGPGGHVHLAYLHCSLPEALRRVSNRDRIERGKLSTRQGLEHFHKQARIAPIPRKNCLFLDSETSSAEKIAQDIITAFDLTGHS